MPRAKVVPFATDADVLLALLSEEVDFALMGKLRGSYYTQRPALSALHIVSETPLEYSLRVAAAAEFAPLVADALALPNTVMRSLEKRWIDPYAGTSAASDSRQTAAIATAIGCAILCGVLAVALFSICAGGKPDTHESAA